MIEYDCGYLVLGRDGVLYFVRHVWTIWSIYEVTEPLEMTNIENVQESWDKVQQEGRYVDDFGRPLGSRV